MVPKAMAHLYASKNNFDTGYIFKLYKPGTKGGIQTGMANNLQYIRKGFVHDVNATVHEIAIGP